MENRLVEEYIGKDANKFMDSKINWTAAILGQSIGPIWFFFRKSYLIGFAFLIITYLVGKVASALGIDKAYYIMFFIYLFTANKLYLWDVRRKVNKILSQSGDMSEEQLVNKVRTKGGTSTLAVVIYVICFVAVFIMLFVTLFFAINALLGV